MTKPLRIVICESNELGALLLRRLLELRGHEPSVATLEQAVERIASRTCDRLLIDTQLVSIPDPRLEGTTVIGLSSSHHVTGFETWLSKPVVAAELWAALDD